MATRHILLAKTAAILLTTTCPVFAQVANDVADALRQKAIFEAHKDDITQAAIVVGAIDNAVICSVKDAQWGKVHRAIALRLVDGLLHEIGITNEQMIYAIHQDVETMAHNTVMKIPCDKVTPSAMDGLAAMLDKLPR